MIFKQGACIFIWHWALKLCNWSCCRQIQGNIFKPKQSLRKKLEMKRSTLMDSRAKYRQGSAPLPLCHQPFTSSNTQWEPRAYSHVPPAWALWCSSSQSQSPLGHCQLGLGSSTTMLLLVIVWNSWTPSSVLNAALLTWWWHWGVSVRNFKSST